MYFFKCAKVYFIFTLRHLIYHTVILDASAQSGPWIIPKVTSAQLCKPIHDSLIIAILPNYCKIAHLNLKNVEMKEKISKNWNIEKKILDGIKSIFDNFWIMFFWQSMKILPTTFNKYILINAKYFSSGIMIAE